MLCKCFNLTIFYHQSGLMGSAICVNNNNLVAGQLTPPSSTFVPITQGIQIKEEHNLLLQKIKSRFKIIDSRSISNLQWYETSKFNLYLYGNVLRDRPIGQCFFYIRDPSINNTPILIATKVSEHYVYSDSTLIVYPDNVLYFGAIKNSLAYLPKGEGKGVLISKQFIYQGEFKNGYPHGFGNYRSENLQYVGDFVNGQPSGQCIQKSATELFVGTISPTGFRVGFKITKNNERKVLTAEEDEQDQNKIYIKSHLKQ